MDGLGQVKQEVSEEAALFLMLLQVTIRMQ